MVWESLLFLILPTTILYHDVTSDQSGDLKTSRGLGYPLHVSHLQLPHTGHIVSLGGRLTLEQHPGRGLTKALDIGHVGSLDGTLTPDQHPDHELTKSLDIGHFGSLDGTLTPEQYPDYELTKSLNSDQFGSLDETLIPDQHPDKVSTKSLGVLPDQILDEHFADGSNIPQVEGLPINHCNVLIDGNQVSCFKPDDGHYDKKLEQLQYHFPALPRVSSGISRCTTLQRYTRRRRTLGSLFSPCVETDFILRTPFFMYNTDKQLRYIVQDPPHIQQCYFDARCRFASGICFRFNVFLLTSKCRLRTCVHTLLAWNPSAPQLGTFFDTFPFACYCECPGHFNKG